MKVSIYHIVYTYGRTQNCYCEALATGAVNPFSLASHNHPGGDHDSLSKQSSSALLGNILASPAPTPGAPDPLSNLTEIQIKVW